MVDLLIIRIRIIGPFYVGTICLIRADNENFNCLLIGGAYKFFIVRFRLIKLGVIEESLIATMSHGSCPSGRFLLAQQICCRKF